MLQAQNLRQSFDVIARALFHHIFTVNSLRESAPVVPGVPPMQTPPPPGVVLSSADSIRLEPVVDSEPQLQAAVSGVSPPDTSSQDSRCAYLAILFFDTLSQQNEADNTAAIAHDIAMAYKVMNTAFFPDSVEFFKHSSAFGSSTPASIVEEVLAVHKFVVLLPDSNLTFQGAHLLRCARNIVLA